MPTLDLATPAFLDSAPLRIVVEKTVTAPIDSCWKLLADQTSWPNWFDGLRLVQASPPTWTEPGQTRTVKVNGLPVHETSISMIPQQEYAFSITKWPLMIGSKAAEAVRLEDVTDGGSPRTKLTYIGAFEPNLVGKLFNRVLDKQFTKAWGPALENLANAANASS